MRIQLKQCTKCDKEPEIIEVDENKFNEWQAGALIQNVWPEKTADERELMITGIHPECWDKMWSFPSEDGFEEVRGNNYE